MMPDMRSLVISLVTLAIVAGRADAAPKKKYHFDIVAVTPKPEVKADVAKTATERVKGQFEKAMAASDQLVAKLDDAPPRDASADTWRKYLADVQLEYRELDWDKLRRSASDILKAGQKSLSDW